MLRPGYFPPPSAAVAGPRDEIYQSERDQYFTDLFENTVCMRLDRWSNMYNEPIACITVTSEKGDVCLHLFKTVDTSGHHDMHDYLLILL